MKKLLFAVLMTFSCASFAGHHHHHHHHHGYWGYDGYYVTAHNPDFWYDGYYYLDSGYGPGYYNSKGCYREYHASRCGCSSRPFFCCN